MKIAINIHGFMPGSGGVETYLSSLISAIQHVDRENSYLLFCDSGETAELFPKSDSFRSVITGYRLYGPLELIRCGLRRLTGYDMLRSKFYGKGIDLVHHPLTILNPSGLTLPSVLTFHDMQQEFFPQFFSKTERERRRVGFLPSVMESRAVITVSSHAKTCLVERYGIDPVKVHVVHSGCGDDCTVRDTETLAQLKKGYALDRPFMIYPAATWPHKNHTRLLKAVRLLVERNVFDGEVLLTGAQKKAHGEIEAEIASLGLTGTVRWLGYIPRNDLVCLYNLARLMVFPSLFEGFGLPVVEAMASGCPVTCSNTTSLPEVAGDAVLYFDPLSVEDMADAIGTLWMDSRLQELHVMRGLQRSALFRWEETAVRTIAVYRQALAG